MPCSRVPLSFLPSYSSENVKTNIIRPVSACLGFFEAIWHFLEVIWHFFVHLDLATLVNMQWSSGN